MEETGYLHVYTGNGKGKTTAAIGLAVRAACAGKRVFIGQFVKGMKYSETRIAEVLPNIEIEQLGLDCFINQAPTQKDKDAAQAGLKRMDQVIQSDNYDLVILDEVTIAIYFKLFSLEDVMQVIKGRPQGMELVCTGRYAPQELMDLADLVTDMKEIKHYYQQGVLSRKGIDC
jgi:cob(I)alamin adenosyltransferase